MAHRQCSSDTKGKVKAALGKRQCGNKFVSSSPLSRDEKAILSDLSIKLKVTSVHGNSKSPCWNYVGNLHSSSENKVIDESRLYCLPCLDVQKAAGVKGHISKVSSFSASTSTGTISLHLSMKHDIHDNAEKMITILGYLNKYDASSSGPSSSCLSSHELNRDIVLWFCKDLIAFEAVSKDGMKDFFHKVLPQIELPSPTTLSSLALDDVYVAVRSHVKSLMQNAKSICLMFDGWTDRYRARPYLGIRAVFIRDWSYKLVTLGCHVLPKHTGREIADHVMHVVKQFVPDVKKIMFSTCHDGAANMVKSSQILKVEHFQHCAAHALHLLLTVDSINTVQEVVDLLQKCRDIVTNLHFRWEQLADEKASVEDKRFIDTLKAKMNEANAVMDLDDHYPVSDNDDTFKKTEHCNATLKAACPTRWNSSLIMIESIIDMHREVMNVLKQIGKAELCLHEDELELLEQLKTFLKPFETFTDLVGNTSPSLSLIPLMKLQIKKLCICAANDIIPIRTVKERILAKVEYRLPDSQVLRVHQLLDPSTKDGVPRLAAVTLLQDVTHSLSKKGLVVMQLSTVDKANSDSPTSKRRKLKMEMLNELRQQNISSGSDVSDVNDVTLEISNYLSCRVSTTDDDILQFWQTNESVYPTLSQVAQLYLVMSASSVPVESMFSITGLICNSRRSSLSPEKLHRVSFIHDNNLWGRMFQRLYDWYDWILDKIVSFDDVTLVTLVTSVTVVVIIVCLSKNVVAADDDAVRERQRRRRPDRPGAQQQQEKHDPPTVGPSTSPSDRTRTSKEILRLTRENYDELIVDAQLRSMTLVLLVEENSKDELLRDFKLMTSPTERLQCGTTCAYLELDKQHKLWYLNLLRSTSMMSCEVLESCYAKANGTVLAVYGQKRYYWIFQGKRNITRTRKNQRGGAEFLGMENSGSDDSDSDSETLQSRQPTRIGLLKDLDNWLDRFYEGTIPKYKVSDWPALD